MQAITFDMDDTLLRDDLTISAFTLDVLRRAAAEGIHIIPASGRARDSMKPFVEQIGCASCYISCNGAEVWSPAHQLLMREKLTREDAQEIAAFGERYQAYAQTYEGPHFYFNAEEDSLWAKAYAKSSMLSGVRVGPLGPYLLEHDTSKILMMDQPEKIAQMLAAAREQFAGRVSVTCSKPYFLEFAPIEADKGKALARCGERLGFGLPEAVAFGDSLNDLSMLQAAGTGICVANAREDVKQLISGRCGSNEEDGVAHYIEQHILQRRHGA